MAAYLTIRLSPDESRALTKLRATTELAMLERITIKELLLKLVADAYKDHLSGKLQMPIYKTTPEIAAHVPGGDNCEQISILKKPEDETALKAIVFGVKRPLTYGQSDAVRELIKLAVAKLDKPAS